MPCSSTYCISNTGLVGADDNYITGGTYNGDTYWTGQTSGWTIYYYTGVTSYWCLSDTLGGTCYLTGKYPCVSSCPDLSSVYVFSGICLTPTPTPTQNCDVLDFTAIFDCEYVPTPTPTPSASVTPTPTVTPSATNFCSIIGIEASGYTYTPTPTATPTVTPTLYDSNSFNRLQFYSPLIERNCPVYGFAEYMTINGQIICPGAQKFQDCFTGYYYYCSNVTGLSAGTIFDTYLVLGASVTVDGATKSTCVLCLGMDYDNGNINQVEITSGAYGYSETGCLSCQIATTPTPTPTMTQTPTMTLTPTSSSPPLEEFIINAVGVNQIVGSLSSAGFVIDSTNNFKINWGDGFISSYSSGVNIPASHTYSSSYSPYTGPIKILSTDLTTIIEFVVQSQPHPLQSLWVSTTELNKLDGLKKFNTVSAIGLFVTGDVVNLPNTLTGLTIYNTNVSGDTSNLPSALTSCIITGTNTISGNTSGLPSNIMTYFYISGNNTISGDVLDLPSATYQCIVTGFNTISGDTSGLPNSTNWLYIDGNNTISGDVSNIYASAQIWILGDNTVSGDTSGFTSPTQSINIVGYNTISGNVSSLPSSLNAINIQGNNTIGGDVAGLPPNITALGLLGSTSVFGDVSSFPSTLADSVINSSGTFTGDIYNLPLPIRKFSLTSGMNLTYTSGRTWANSFSNLILSPTNIWAGFNSTETDNLLNNIQPKYINTAGNNSFTIKCSGTPKRTSASDAAYNALVALLGPGDVTLN